MLDELKLRYKELALLKRLAICLLVAILPAALLYLDESTVVDDEYMAAEQAEKIAASKLLEADKMLKNLAKVESELAFTREQLKKAESRLPDTVAIDEILRTVGRTAKDAGVDVRLFEPLPEVLRGDNYKYSELPVKIAVEAHEYGQLCEWLDTLAGIKSKIYLKAWKISRRLLTPQGKQAMFALPPAMGTEIDPSLVAEQQGREARENFRLVLEADLSLFKLPTAAQLSAPDPSIKDDKKKSNPEKKSATPNSGATKEASAEPTHREAISQEKEAA